jgi:ABC-type nitrate/sulfonate/bicarbonate transport system permease component
MVLAVVVGIPVGILLARSETAGRILRSLGQRFRERPVSALVPLLMAVVASARRPWS